MRHQLQGPVAHQFTALPAKREDRVAHQDHAGALLVMMADLVNPGMMHRLSGNQHAIGLVKYCVIFVF